MTNFTLKQAEAFLAVVEGGSLTDAGARLHVTAGAVSAMMTEMETAIGAQLLVRVRGKGVQITPIGRWVAQRARQLLATAAEIHELAGLMQGEITGRFQVGCFTTLSPWLLPRVAEHFSRTYPTLHLDFAEGATADLLQQLRLGTLDIVITYRNHVAPGLATISIAPARLQVVLSPKHRLARLPEIALADLAQDPAILIGVEPAKTHVEEILASVHPRSPVRWYCKSIETIRGLVARNLGYAIIMARPHGDSTYDGLPLIYRPIADELPPNAVVMVIRKEEAALTAKVRALIAYCRTEIGPVQ